MNSYFGSKATSGLCQPIIAMMPPHDTYIETHLGGGAIMRRKPAALRNIAIDLDPKPLAVFECDYPVEKIHSCAHRFLSDYVYRGRELVVYCDPPYLHHTRSLSRRYRFDYEQQDHIELLTILKALPCSVILSGYPSDLYDELLVDWGTLELQVMNQTGVRTEKLWFNFVPDRIHGCRYAGKNFTDRQRIKRKAQSWGRQYQALPRAKRLAVLSSIMAVEAIEQIGIIPRYGGVVIHDCWQSYLCYDHCRHGLRELTFIVDSNEYRWASNMKRLLQETCVIVTKRESKQLTKKKYKNLKNPIERS